VTVFLLLTHSPTKPPIAAESATDPPPPASETGPGKRPLSLDDYRALKKEADELVEAPEGPERIAKCEAFLKSHPAYPDAYSILQLLVSDLTEASDTDPVYVARLLEQMEELRSDPYGMSGLYLLEHYLLKYQPVPAGADRILERSRKAIERSRVLLQKEPDVRIRERPSPDNGELRVLLDEGRILLSRGNAAGALKKLREAEQKGISTGQFFLLRYAQGNRTKVLPTTSYFLDWLNLSMAEAYARLGDKAPARDRLERVADVHSSNVELTARREKLRSDLGAPPPEKTEVRADPAPAPDFSLEDQDGKRVGLADYRGQVVLVMLWATW
jgi:tetratricopeptide (TPR) repeat protein